MSNRQPPSNDELEVAEAKNPLVDLLYDYTAQALMSRIGSYVYHRFDACLAIVEKTAKWSLPQPLPSEEDPSKTTISAPPLVRPLPWILFLPALIALRLLRCCLSFVALLIGKQPVYPITLVSFLQNRRRKLRALKYRGLKLQRMQRAENESEPEVEQQMGNTWLRRITLPLRYIICFKAVRPGTTVHQRNHHHHHHRHQQTQESRELADEPVSTNGSDQRNRSATKKRNAHERDADDSESSFDEATVQELLEKYASAEADSSFHASDTSSSSSDSDLMDSDKSLPEENENAEEHDTKKIKKESNGHAAAPGQTPESKSEQPQETNRKSSLNTTANNGKPEIKPVESAQPENGNVAAKKENSEQKPNAAQHKSTPIKSERTEIKPVDANRPGKEQPPEDASARNESHNSSNKQQSPSSMKEVKSSFHQRNKQHQHHHQQAYQQQQTQNANQPNQHQPSYIAANGGGAGGRKQKKPHQQNAQYN